MSQLEQNPQSQKCYCQYRTQDYVREQQGYVYCTPIVVRPKKKNAPHIIHNTKPLMFLKFTHNMVLSHRNTEKVAYQSHLAT